MKFYNLQEARRHTAAQMNKKAQLSLSNPRDAKVPYSSSRSSKVIDLGVNWKPMYDFLLVTNSNFGRICYRFRDIDA